MRICRVTVRGWFHDLTGDQREALRPQAAEHDVVSTGAFTEADEVDPEVLAIDRATAMVSIWS